MSMPDDRSYCGRCRSYCARNAPCPCCHSRGGHLPHTPARDAINAYEERVPGARQARLADSTSQYAHHLTVHLLDIMNAAMQDERIEAPERYRVIQAVLYGSSSPADAWQREQMTKRFVESIELRVPQISVDLTGSGVDRAEADTLRDGVLRLADLVAFEPSALAAAAARGDEAVTLTLPVPAPCAIELSSDSPYWERIWAYDCVGDGPYTVQLGTADATQPDGILHLKLGSAHAAGAKVTVVTHA